MAEQSDPVRDALVPYLELLTQFVNNAITADEIETRYIALFSSDSISWPHDVFRALEDFFFAVDDYVSLDHLRTQPEDLDGDQLRGKAIDALAALGAALGSSGI